MFHTFSHFLTPSHRYVAFLVALISTVFFAIAMMKSLFSLSASAKKLDVKTIATVNAMVRTSPAGGVKRRRDEAVSSLGLGRLGLLGALLFERVGAAVREVPVVQRDFYKVSAQVGDKDDPLQFLPRGTIFADVDYAGG